MHNIPRTQRKDSVWMSALSREGALHPLSYLVKVFLEKKRISFTRLTMKLAEKCHRPYYQTVSFVKSRFAVSLVRTKKRCIRGSTISTNRISHRVDWEDGAGLGLYSTLE